jgi:adenosylcobinamide-GDP ribazoletransferase
MMHSFILAFALLTKIPMPDISAPDPKAYGFSVLFYPLVGMVIGLILVGMAWVLDGLAPDLLAALLLLAWVWLTGGLHLDGLADVTDAWIGGMGGRDKTLAILKDPRSGPAAIVAVVLLLLIKFTALQVLLIGEGSLLGLLFAPLFGRLATIFLFLTLSYIRDDGMGAAIAANLPRKAAWTVLVVFTLIPTLFLDGWEVSLIFITIFLTLFRHKIQQRPGGVTGDFLGAGCELTEAVFLISLAFIPLF